MEAEMPSKLWRYIELTSAEDPTPVTHTLTEDEILREYYPYWVTQMRRAGKDESLITPQNCIEDWVVVHWAWEIANEPR